MIFNRGNKLVKRDFSIALENVKVIKYLGFSIAVKNYSFRPTIDDVSIQANRALFAVNNRFEISKLSKKLAIKHLTH